MKRQTIASITLLIALWMTISCAPRPRATGNEASFVSPDHELHLLQKQAKMPRGWGWTVSDDEAFDVAAYITIHSRSQILPTRSMTGQRGGCPEDAPY
ncbi:MAG TPA: hypothetical protein VFU48_10565 [Nitrospira sp.]|nr:hypothetical protein [Nitrospira sp.]